MPSLPQKAGRAKKNHRLTEIRKKPLNLLEFVNKTLEKENLARARSMEFFPGVNNMSFCQCLGGKRVSQNPTTKIAK